MKKLLLLSVLVGTMMTANAQSTTVTISQVYGGGGATTGSPAYMYDYVELHNLTAAAIDLTGFSLQYGSSTGNFGAAANQIYAFPAATSIAAYGYFTVKLGTAGTVGADFTADLTSSNLNMAAGSGKVALVNSSMALGCGATATPCTLPNAAIVDLVAYGASNNAEGGVSVNNGAALNNTQGAVRNSFGCTDTDNNNANFTVSTTGTGLVPRTAASGTTTNCSTLPVNITSFSGRKKGTGIELQWAVSQEQNITSYLVERSASGAAIWTTVSSVTATTSTDAKTYTFTDASPLKGINLYRLQQVELNGSRKQSKVVQVDAGVDRNNFTLSPNPAKGSTWIRSINPVSEMVAVQILDASGRVVSKQSSVVSLATPLKLDVSRLQPGQYFIQVTTNEKTQTDKIIISE